MGTTQSTNTCGFLVVGHGTRNPQGQRQMQQLHQRIAKYCLENNLADYPTEFAFLELAEPGIAAAMDRLSAAGVQEIVVIPALLFSAGHAQSDIPGEVAGHASRLGIRIKTQTRSLCCDNSVVELSVCRFHEALGKASAAAIPHDQIGLAMIGRGSSSEDATEAMLQFAELRNRRCPVAWSTTGFIHAQRPSVDEALDGLAATGLPWLVVQPHLLFEGKLMDDLREEVRYRQSFSTSQKWIITETLGPDPVIAEALCRLANEDDQANANCSACIRCGMPKQFC